MPTMSSGLPWLNSRLVQKMREGYELDAKLWAGLWMIDHTLDGTPLLALTRPAWEPEPGDQWHRVPDMPAAVAALAGPPRRVLDSAATLPSPVLYMLVAHYRHHIRAAHLHDATLLGWSRPSLPAANTTRPP